MEIAESLVQKATILVVDDAPDHLAPIMLGRGAIGRTKVHVTA